MQTMLSSPFAALLAVADGPGVDLSLLSQYGVLGLLSILLIWFAKGAHQRERERADRMEAENKRLQELIIERIIPALTAASHAAEDSNTLLRAMQRERELIQLTKRHPTGPVSTSFSREEP